MKTNNSLQKELSLVKNLIKNEIIEEDTISELYNYIFKSNGKRLRAQLSLIASSPNKRKNKSRLKLASIIELLHTATLIHDDVVDESQTRRGVKSVNNVWSNTHGVLIGDYIYSKAFILMVQIGDIKILKELANATNDISKGELIQLDALQNTSITLSKLENISYYKTGRLFEAAAKSGAMLANKDKKYESNISKCAKNLGILFQIKDDLLDYSLDEKVIGKPVFQDLKEGKITYPFYFAYRNANKKQKNQLQTMLGKKKQNIKSAYNMIKDLSGFAETEILASKYFDKAIKHANLIKNKHINQEVLKLVNSALYREK
ncbi:MAG: polyprenyl synthetase family protein [Proteobacteria bacterium]|nr:polyprenyl synthetase family protein [Pseudomonadota bacterium]NCX10477.1 polyprenyl synthetase family protein [Pseudomonadota bacterium]